MTDERLEHLCKTYWEACPTVKPWEQTAETVKELVRSRMKEVIQQFDDMVYKTNEPNSTAGGLNDLVG